MSSRILPAEAASAAQPIAWAQTGRRVPVLPARPPSSHGEGPDAHSVQERLARFEAELRQREAAARQAGFQEGEETAESRLAAPLRETAERMAAHVEELAGLRRKLRREAEEDLVRLAVAIARRILRRELTAEPSAILGIVKAALERIDAREVLRIRVHPDVAFVLEDSLHRRSAPERVEVLPDGGLERGAVVIETSRGSFDASIETQLQEIERGLADRVSRSR